MTSSVPLWDMTGLHCRRRSSCRSGEPSPHREASITRAPAHRVSQARLFALGPKPEDTAFAVSVLKGQRPLEGGRRMQVLYRAMRTPTPGAAWSPRRRYLFQSASVGLRRQCSARQTEERRSASKPWRRCVAHACTDASAAQSSSLHSLTEPMTPDLPAERPGRVVVCAQRANQPLGVHVLEHGVLHHKRLVCPAGCAEAVIEEDAQFIL